MLLVSYINPFSTQFHAINDFRKRLGTTQKAYTVAALIFSTLATASLLVIGKHFIVPIILLEIAVFRLATGFFKERPGNVLTPQGNGLTAGKTEAHSRPLLHKSYTDNAPSPAKRSRNLATRCNLLQPLPIMQSGLSIEELAALEAAMSDTNLTIRAKELSTRHVASFWNALQKKWCGAQTDHDIECGKSQLGLILDNLTQENFKILVRIDSFWTVVQSQDYSKTVATHLTPQQLEQMAIYAQNIAITTMDPRFDETLKKVVNAFVNIVGCVLPERVDTDYLLAVIDYAIPPLENLLKAKIVQMSDEKTEQITQLEHPFFKKSATLELPKTIRRGSVAARKSAFLHALRTDAEMPEKEERAIVHDPRKLAHLERLDEALKSFNVERSTEIKNFTPNNRTERPYSQRISTSQKEPEKIAPPEKYVVKLDDTFYHTLLNQEAIKEVSEDFFFWILAKTSVQDMSDPFLEKKTAFVQRYYADNTDPDKYQQLAHMTEHQLQNLGGLLGDKVHLLWEQEKRACGARSGRDLEHIADRVLNEVKFLSLDQLSTSMDAFLFIIRSYPEHVATGLTPDHFAQIAKQAVSMDECEALQLLVKKLSKQDTQMESKLKSVAPFVKDATLKTLVEERAGLLGISKRKEIMALLQS